MNVLKSAMQKFKTEKKRPYNKIKNLSQLKNPKI